MIDTEGRPHQSYYAKKAILEFLEEEEDYLLALARLVKHNPRISLEEVERQPGLKD